MHHSFFDPVLWERVRKEFILHFESLCVLRLCCALDSLPLLILTQSPLVGSQRDSKNVGRAAQLEPFLVPSLFFPFLRRWLVARCRGLRTAVLSILLCEVPACSLSL